MRTKMTAAEIEAEIMRRIKGHPDCNNVSRVPVHSTGERPPNPTWAVGNIVTRGWEVAAAKRHIDEVVSEMQAEIDLANDPTA